MVYLRDRDLLDCPVLKEHLELKDLRDRKETRVHLVLMELLDLL